MEHCSIRRDCPPSVMRVSLAVRSLACVLACWPSGCGTGSVMAAGGTSGTVKFRGAVLTGLRVSLYAESGDRVAVGTTDADGKFVLRHEETAEAVDLHAGRFRVALESAGGEVLPLPMVYSDRVKSPLVVDWSGGEGPMEIVLPEGGTASGS